jgi:LuxR family maltose regulon positive regulatory protein
MREFLLTTSIVDRLCAPLCDALLAGGSQQTSASGLLDSAQRASLFITALDDDGRWFRYHHLFRRLLQRELHAHLDRHAIAALHQHASAWFASQDLLEEAVVHQLAAGDQVAAARLVEEWVHPLLNREQWRTLQRLLELLPESVRERPALVVARAWLFQFTGQGASIPALLGPLEPSLGTDGDLASNTLSADIDALLSLSRALEGNPGVGLEHARRAISRIPA